MAQDVVVSDIQEMPVSGRDYPRTWEQFLDWFPDNDACIVNLAARINAAYFLTRCTHAQVTTPVQPLGTVREAPFEPAGTFVELAYQDQQFKSRGVDAGGTSGK